MGQTLSFALPSAEQPQDPWQSFLSSLWPVSISAFIATTISRPTAGTSLSPEQESELAIGTF